MTKGYQPSDYAAQLNKMRKPGDVLSNAYIRIGGREPILMPGRSMNQAAGVEMQKQVDIIHAYVAEELAKFEKPGEPRDKQNDIIVHCFSGLSWKFALVSYDAIRSYEANTGNMKYTGNPEELMNARAVTFAPPRVRDYTANELGNELYEIIHTK